MFTKSLFDTISSELGIDDLNHYYNGVKLSFKEKINNQTLNDSIFFELVDDTVLIYWFAKNNEHITTSLMYVIPVLKNGKFIDINQNRFINMLMCYIEGELDTYWDKYYKKNWEKFAEK